MKICEHIHDPSSTRIAFAYCDIGAIYTYWGKDEEGKGNLTEATNKYQLAETSLLKGISLAKSLLGNEHPNVADVLLKLGELRQWQEQFEEALKKYEEVLTIWNRFPLSGTRIRDRAEKRIAEIKARMLV